MPDRLKPSAELFFMTITTLSTMAIPWGLLVLKLIVGVATYFISRMAYRYFKKDIDGFIDSIKKK